jgi:hypothetical protein
MYDLITITHKNWHHDFDYILAEVATAVPPGTQIFKRKKSGLIAWKSGQVRQGFWFICYDGITYRIKTGRLFGGWELPSRFRDIHKGESRWTDIHLPCCRTELSFHFSEIGLIKGRDLVAFVNSAFEVPLAGDQFYRWPLFEHDQGYPNYAWSRLGELQVEKRRREREAKRSMMQTL